MEGKKFDQDKPMIGLIPGVFLWGVARVLTSGAKKYGMFNWLQGMEWHRPYNALLRHLTAWWDGEDKDAETGESHLIHAACELMFLVVYEAWGIGKDTRFQRTQQQDIRQG